ncbi:hypothetical protein Pan216_21020 [Planctomycetes bacterium Pan216]|uniref:Uncharacterized protein n=1 Tax=Kolteria novifilia TaxID=2527975 RepID=A0A518B2P7_9BACT|nr:hypothetical protein Pan216_21020 [Planctomycetes bacterium Pan216]
MPSFPYVVNYDGFKFTIDDQAMYDSILAAADRLDPIAEEDRDPEETQLQRFHRINKFQLCDIWNKAGVRLGRQAIPRRPYGDFIGDREE